MAMQTFHRLVLAATMAVLMQLPSASLNALEPLKLYLFTAPGCPHCIAAQPYIEQLQQRHPDLELVEYNVWDDRKHFDLLVAVGKTVGTGSVSTPALVVGRQVWFGFDAGIAGEVETAIERCLRQPCSDLVAQLRSGAGAGPAQTPEPAPQPVPAITLPGFGSVDPDTLSLPVVTVVIGLLDSFNPCAFFILLFLLSLMLHAGSRRTMLLVGGVFVLCSGLIYLLFMAAWLNLFLLAGQLRMVTLAAGGIALVIAGINIKDYFFFHQGVTLSIPETAKPRLFARMRQLLKAPRTATVLFGTVVLAIAANTYELLCTAGFPMVYTRLLTLRGLSTWQHYFYLLFYNLVYILPLLIIVIVFTLTLGRRQLSEWHGRILKLVSGMMMLMLGAVLLVDPALLNHLPLAGGLLLAALLAAALIIALDRVRNRWSHHR